MEALNSFLKNKNRYGYSGIIVYETIVPDFYKKKKGSVWKNAERKGKVMNFDSLNIILTIAAFIVGIMLLTGHGDIFLKGGNADIRKKLYDEEKMAKASGVALILIGIVSAVDLFTTALAFKIAYIVALLIIIIGLVYYLRVKCKK